MSNKYCSPEYSGMSATCYTTSDLEKIVKEYNKGGKNLINMPNKKSKNYRTELWNEIQDKLSKGSCDNDVCFSEGRIVKKALGQHKIEKIFRPKKPYSWESNPNEWLSTIDINSVMNQYEKKYPDFKFMGAVPIDFDSQASFGGCVSPELCKINLRDLIKKNIRRIGVVFNSDPHYKPGAHWTSMFADLNNGGIYYFDSYGVPPPKEVQILMLKLKNQGDQLLNEKTLIINDLKDTHTVVRDFKKLDNYKIVVPDDSAKLFRPNNLIYFGGYLKKRPVLDDKTFNRIIKMDNNIITMQKPLHKDYPIVAMKSFRTFYNDRKFQYQNTECGVYSMHFIEEFLNGKTYDQIIDNNIYDDEMSKNRDRYYRPNLKAI